MMSKWFSFIFYSNWGGFLVPSNQRP